MAFKNFIIDDQTTVRVYKRRASRSLRLSVTASGLIRVSIPAWAPYASGIEFAHSRLEWIKKQRPAPELLEDNQAIGRAHRLKFISISAISKPTSRVKPGEVVISYPPNLTVNSPEVQKLALKASQRALRLQSEKLLPQRLYTLSEKVGLDYTSVSIKQLKSRWGSCDQDKNIVLNLFLIQLPWELIDYVLLHELTHTKVMKHGPEFWEAMTAILPDTQSKRKALRSYQPILMNSSLETSRPTANAL